MALHACKTAGVQSRRFQKGPVSPMLASSVSASSSVCRLHPGLSLSLYQPWASCQPCRGVSVAPRFMLRVWHQRSMCSSARKMSIVLQVNPMLSDQWCPGTRK
jgi:hypothetical protein